jgi:hypothetical protein
MTQQKPTDAMPEHLKEAVTRLRQATTRNHWPDIDQMISHICLQAARLNGDWRPIMVRGEVTQGTSKDHELIDCKPTDAEAVEALAKSGYPNLKPDSSFSRMWAEAVIETLRAQGFHIVRVK